MSVADPFGEGGDVRRFGEGEADGETGRQKGHHSEDGQAESFYGVHVENEKDPAGETGHPDHQEAADGAPGITGHRGDGHARRTRHGVRGWCPALDAVLMDGIVLRRLPVPKSPLGATEPVKKKEPMDVPGRPSAQISGGRRRA